MKRITNILAFPLRKFWKMSWKKKIVTVIILVIAIAFIASQFGGGDGYTTEVVEKADVTEKVSESGTISVGGGANVYSPSNGFVDEVYVKNNQMVKKGEKLFSVVSSASAVEKASAYSTLVAAKTALDKAENNRRATEANIQEVYDDLKDHDDDETIAQKNTRTAAEVSHDNAYESLLAAQAAYASASRAYAATQNAVVTSPVDGIVANLAVAKGSNVKVYNSLIASAPALIVKGTGISEMVISVGENDINKLRPGQDVVIEVDAIEQKEYKGAITRVDDVGTVTDGVVKFSAYIAIVDSDSNLKTGMSADAEIVTTKLENVLSVPNSAVKRYEGSRAVRVPKDGGEFEYVKVVIGVKGEDRTEILEGLDEGQVIITSLSNGSSGSSFGF